MPTRPQPGISRPRAPVRMVTMRKADEDMAARLAAEQAREANEAGRIEREEPHQVPGGRESVLEEARAELSARAGRAGRELDHVRAERAELGRA